MMKIKGQNGRERAQILKQEEEKDDSKMSSVKHRLWIHHSDSLIALIFWIVYRRIFPSKSEHRWRTKGNIGPKTKRQRTTGFGIFSEALRKTFFWTYAWTIPSHRTAERAFPWSVKEIFLFVSTTQLLNNDKIYMEIWWTLVLHVWDAFLS